MEVINSIPNEHRANPKEAWIHRPDTCEMSMNILDQKEGRDGQDHNICNKDASFPHHLQQVEDM